MTNVKKVEKKPAWPRHDFAKTQAKIRGRSNPSLDKPKPKIDIV